MYLTGEQADLSVLNIKADTNALLAGMGLREDTAAQDGEDDAQEDGEVHG